MGIVKTCGYLGLVLYAPALVVSTVTPIPIYACILVTGLIATGYTIKGGMLAVVWTDFIQSLVMIFVAVVTFIVALVRIQGGFAEVFHVLSEHDMLIEAPFFWFHSP